MIPGEGIRLDEFDKEEWRDIVRFAMATMGRTLDDKTFDQAWEEFAEAKRRRGLQ